jgi:hypothetical protein
MFGEPPQLGRNVRSSTSHSSPFLVCGLQSKERRHDDVSVRFPTTTLTFLDPFRRREVTALTIAASAGGDLVFDHARATLDSGYEMFGRGFDEPDFEFPATPDAG